MTELNAQPQGLRIPDDLLAGLADREEEIREFVWTEIIRGNADVTELSYLIEDLAEVEGGDGGDPPGERYSAIARYLVDARRAQQAGFGEVPPTRLDRAFEALQKAHIVAKQDFTCCNTCGHAEIGDDLGDEIDQWLGYVFFHQQDTEDLVDSGSTYLSYGIFWPAHLSEAEYTALNSAQREKTYDDKTVALMRTVVIPTLQNHGLGVSWDGSVDTRILLTGADWYAPLPPAEN